MWHKEDASPSGICRRVVSPDFFLVLYPAATIIKPFCLDIMDIILI